MSISRRDALKLGVTVGVVGGASGLLLKAAAETSKTPTRQFYSVPSICGMCMGQCAIYIDVVDGKPVRIRSNTNALLAPLAYAPEEWRGLLTLGLIQTP